MDNQLVIGGVALMPLIVGVVQMVKSVWPASEPYARMISAVLVVLAFVSAEYLKVLLEYTRLATQGLQALVWFLGTARFYHLTKSWAK